ncbi:hypothetical protein ACFTSF_16305 [Kribbella sp. NPDC056951]|uniref:hypothetical protein n=1 Tax=Kribbella sp. NPDC056951 TaxID=3345978 RepID=UPI003625B3FF
MTTGWTEDPPYQVFTDPAFVLRLLLDPGEPLDQVCNVDAFLDIPGKGTWAATVFSLDEVRRLMDRWRTTGENANGAYFAGVDNIIVREPGVDSIVAAVRDLVEEGSYDLFLVQCNDEDSADPLETLQELIGISDADTSDGHIRWSIYQRAMSIPEAHRALRIAVTDEPDKTLATAVVVALFDHVAPPDRASWINALPRRARAFPTRRSDEMLVAEAHHSGPPPVDISTWSDWLLRRVAASSTSKQTLIKLAAEARTKRARNLAATRAKTINFTPADSRAITNEDDRDS